MRPRKGKVKYDVVAASNNLTGILCDNEADSSEAKRNILSQAPRLGSVELL